MKSGILLVVVMIGGIVMAISGGIDLGRMSAAAPFDYEAATAEERETFLKAEAAPISKSLKRALINPSGVGTTMRLAKTRIDGDTKKITFVIKVQGKMGTGWEFDQAKIAMYKKICPGYVAGALGRNAIKLVQDFRDKDNRSLIKVTVSPTRCERYVQA